MEEKATTRRAGRPKKTEAPAQKTSKTAQKAEVKKAPPIKRVEKVDSNKEFEVLRNAGIALMLPQKGVTVYDETSDSVREIRYCPNEQSIFRDEQSDNARRESVAFRDGRLFVPKEKPNLRKFIEAHQQNQANGGSGP